ncbi:MAG: efflux RND transporter periplasmic adaptor subunit [Fimbriimonadaceae bacterium]
MRAITLILPAVAAVMIGCVDREAQQQSRETAAIINDPTVPVSLEEARLQTITETFEITGQLVTSADSMIGAQVGGRLVGVFVKDGDPVTAGQVIAVQDTANAEAQYRQAMAGLSAAQSQLQQALSNARLQPARSAAGVAAAESQLRAARAQLDKARTGARAEEIRQAEAAVRGARAGADHAKRELDRARALLAEGAVSQQRVDAAQAAYDAALSQYEAAVQSLAIARDAVRPEDLRSAEEGVRLAEENLRGARAAKELDVLLSQQVVAARAAVRSAQAQVDLARKQIEDARIKAPFSGRISGNPTQPGTVLGPGSPVARIIGGEGIYFQGEVPEGKLGFISVGQNLQVTIDALGGRTFSGRVAAIDPAGQELGRIFRVRISIDQTDPSMKPGMFARGILVTRRVEDAVVVPQAAIRQEGDKAFVFRAVDNKAVRTEVELGMATDGLQQVIGVPAGALVVVRGSQAVFDGATLAAEPTPAASGTPAGQKQRG